MTTDMTRKWWTLTTVCLGIVMLLLDITIVNVALPSIASDLDASFQRPAVDDRRVRAVARGADARDRLARRSARPSRRLRRRGRERGTALGIWGATAGAAVALGPLIGGALTSGISWRWVFFVNVPIGALTLWMLLAKVAETRRRRVRPDWLGATLFSGALFARLRAHPRQPGRLVERRGRHRVRPRGRAAGAVRRRRGGGRAAILGLGLTLVTIGIALMTLVDASSSRTVLLAGFIVAGASSGLTNPRPARAQ